MKEQFESYLVSQGYKEFNDKGQKSTVYSYSNAVNKVCQYEGLGWFELASDIDNIVAKYDIGGEKEEIGNRSKKTYINALKRFREFIKLI